MAETQSGMPRIGALRKTTLVDYPGHVSAALFLHSCNLRCPYCYNRELVVGTPDDYDAVTFDDVLKHLEKRSSVLSGFVISGGEPCGTVYVEKLIAAAKEYGYQVKLDTNGTYPEKLEQLLSSAELTPDFIAMDIKTNPARYDLLGRPCKDEVMRSAALVASLPPERREFRTVLVPPLVAESDIQAMAEILPADASWRFAQFQPGGCIRDEYNSILPYTQEEADALVAFAKNFVRDAALR